MRSFTASMSLQDSNNTTIVIPTPVHVGRWTVRLPTSSHSAGISTVPLVPLSDSTMESGYDAEARHPIPRMMSVSSTGSGFRSAPATEILMPSIRSQPLDESGVAMSKGLPSDVAAIGYPHIAQALCPPSLSISNSLRSSYSCPESMLGKSSKCIFQVPDR